MGTGDTLLNAGIGAAVTVLLSFLGVSSVLGGGVAGYLQGETRRVGAKVGALSGALATVPLVLAVVAFYALVLVGVAGGGIPVGPGILVVALVLVPLALLWNVALGAAGGYLGTYVDEEYGTAGSAAGT
jgi:hypothetical protein